MEVNRKSSHYITAATQPGAGGVKHASSDKPSFPQQVVGTWFDANSDAPFANSFTGYAKVR